LAAATGLAAHTDGALAGSGPCQPMEYERVATVGSANKIGNAADYYVSRMIPKRTSSFANSARHSDRFHVNRESLVEGFQ
jgi:hypothetical protein